MMVELNEHEIEALVTVVKFSISELSPEIVAADNWENRTLLKDRRAALQSALDKLQSTAG